MQTPMLTDSGLETWLVFHRGAEQLDDGDPIGLGSLYASLVEAHPHLRVLGGCCGTDAKS